MKNDDKTRELIRTGGVRGLAASLVIVDELCRPVPRPARPWLRQKKGRPHQ